MKLEDNKISITSLALEVMKTPRAVKDIVIAHKKEFEFYGELGSVTEDTKLNRDQILLALSRMYIYPPAKVKMINDLFPTPEADKCLTCKRIENLKDGILSLLDIPIKPLFTNIVISEAVIETPSVIIVDTDFEQKLTSV